MTARPGASYKETEKAMAQEGEFNLSQILKVLLEDWLLRGKELAE